MAGQDQKRGGASKAAAQAPKDPAAAKPAAGSDTDAAASSTVDARDEAAADPGDDVRRKFRESLQRKQKQQGANRSADGTGKGGSKVHDGFGPTTGRRSFRRKSGS
jgi:hypothetical protein